MISDSIISLARSFAIEQIIERTCLPNDQAAAAWQRYASAKMRADCTGSPKDIEQAKCAWSAWLIEFLPCDAERRAVPAPRFQRLTEVRERLERAHARI